MIARQSYADLSPLPYRLLQSRYNLLPAQPERLAKHRQHHVNSLLPRSHLDPNVWTSSEPACPRSRAADSTLYNAVSL